MYLAARWGRVILVRRISMTPRGSLPLLRDMYPFNGLL